MTENLIAKAEELWERRRKGRVVPKVANPDIGELIIEQSSDRCIAQPAIAVAPDSGHRKRLTRGLS